MDTSLVDVFFVYLFFCSRFCCSRFRVWFEREVILRLEILERCIIESFVEVLNFILFFLLCESSYRVGILFFFFYTFYLSSFFLGVCVVYKGDRRGFCV